MSLDYQALRDLIERLDIALRGFTNRLEELQSDEPMEHFLKANKEGRSIEGDGTTFGGVFIDPQSIVAVEDHGPGNKLTTIHVEGGKSFDVRIPKEEDYRRLVREPEAGEG